jgi:hypothetical protein
MPSCHVTDVPTLNLFLLFITGLTISLGHCLGMCGPIQTAFSLEQRRRGSGVLLPLLRYHSGRVISYTAIGTAFGALGSTARLVPATAPVQASIALLSATLILAAAGATAGFPRLATVHAPAWGAGAGVWVGRFLRARSGGGQILLGVANGFLPCGPVLTVALAAAAAGGAGRGGMVMATYGAGTVPALVVLGVLSHRLAPRTRRRFVIVGAGLMAVIGLQLLLRGLSALGLIGHLHAGGFVFW